MKLNIEQSTFRKLIILPILLLLISASMLAINYSREGELFKKSIDMQGGVQVIFDYDKPIDSRQFESALRTSLSASDVDVVTITSPTTRKQESVVVSVAGDIESSEVVSGIEQYLNIQLPANTYSTHALGSALASTFLSQARLVFIFAFIFMAIVVFFYLRSPLSSIAIIIAIACDVVVILGFMSFLNIRLSLATTAGLLMIIGYGVDSNVLLSNKLTQEKEGSTFERLRSALKTGITMSATTISALTVLFIIANSLVLREIAGVLLIGLLADLVNTWILNSNILLWRLK